jgi:hypothetical protein
MSSEGTDFFDILRQIPAIPGYLLTAGQLVRWAYQRYSAYARARRPPAREIVEHRVRMRAEIEERLRRHRREGSSPADRPDYEDIVVRDVRRLDAFPDLDADEIGISPWIKLEVHGLYHRGIEVFLFDVKKAVQIEGARGLGDWRFLGEGEFSDDAVNAVPVGRIPFDFIEKIDWSGDEYYGAPHFFCRYAGPFREPYEEIIYRAILYPSVGRHYIELVGLKPDRDSWGVFRRLRLRLSQSARRLFRRFRRAKTT